MASLFRPSSWRWLRRAGDGVATTAAANADARARRQDDLPSPVSRDLRSRIEERAYMLWRDDGCPAGHDVDYWLRAEQELLDESHRSGRSADGP